MGSNIEQVLVEQLCDYEVLTKMKRKNLSHLTHIIGFVAVFVVVLLVLENIFFNIRSISYNWYRVQNDEEEINVLILGNSHAYTSTNAALLSDVFGGINVEVFASSSLNMEEVLIHLKQALKYKSPNYIFLEIEAPCVDSRLALQEEKRGLLMQDLDGIKRYDDKLIALAQTLNWENIPEGMFQLFRPTSMWSRWDFSRNKAINISTTHGYEAAKTANSYATGTALVLNIENEAKNNLTQTALTTYNEAALREFLDITEKNNIKVVLYKAPLMRTMEFGLMASVFEIAAEYDNVIACENYCAVMTDMGLELEDFYDTGHLNKRGGEKFTVYMANNLATLLGYDADWSDVWGYKGECAQQLSDGTWQYSIENYTSATLYQFTLQKGRDVIQKQEYSANNTFLTDININESDDYQLYCAMIPEECLGEGDQCPERVNISFMKQNTCIIE